MSFPVEGWCPVGCGPTLETSAADGRIRCAAPECPRPTAAAEILADRETEHIVEFDEIGFTIRHPLRERLDDALLQCVLHAQLARLDNPPTPGLGRYRARRVIGNPETWAWESLQ